MPLPAGARVAYVLGGIALVYFGLLWEQRGRREGQVPVYGSACGCGDEADLEARRQQAQAVINELNQIVSELEFEGLLDPVPYSRERQTAGTERNGQALNNANNRNLGSGDTDENCLTKVTGPSGCMQAVLQAHENVHEAECSAYKKSGGTDDYKASKTMAEYWKEDLRGYQEELRLIKEAEDFIDNLNPRCPTSERPSLGESPEEQMERLHRGRERVNEHITAIS